MTTILDLPPELVETIAHRLFFPRDILSLRASCKYVDGILTPHVLSSIVLDLSHWQKAPMLIRMAARPNRVHHFARALDIRSLAPASNEDPDAPPIVMERDGSFSYLHRSSTKDVTRAEQIITQYLPGALKHFHNLQHVGWKTHPFDVVDSNRVIMDMLASQSALSQVSIDMSRDLSYPFPQLGRLSQLSKLAITFPRIHIQCGPLFAGTAEAIRKSPNLTAFHLELQPDYSHPDLVTLDDVYARVTSLSHLGGLGLVIPTMVLDDHMVSHLRHLTVLNIQTRELFKGYREMWGAFEKHQIYLKTICFNLLNIEVGFLDYLGSYSGVEDLLLSNRDHYWINDMEDNSHLATRFFSEILPMHANTLRVLDMVLFWPSTWQTVPKIEHLNKMLNLRKVRIDLTDEEVRLLQTRRDLVEYPFTSCKG